MLDLDDPRWAQLKGNYTNGTQIVELLSQAHRGVPLERWYDALFQQLCHQYTVSEAAYAALPHLIALAEERQDARAELLILAASCYTFSARLDLAPIPAEFTGEWHAAARAAVPLVTRLLEETDQSENTLRYLLFALAAFKGVHPLAAAIEALDTVVECPNCGHLVEWK